MYVGVYREEWEERREGRKKKHPHRVLLSDIGFVTNYNAIAFLPSDIQSYG